MKLSDLEKMIRRVVREELTRVNKQNLGESRSKWAPPVHKLGPKIPANPYGELSGGEDEDSSAVYTPQITATRPQDILEQFKQIKRMELQQETVVDVDKSNAIDNLIENVMKKGKRG